MIKEDLATRQAMYGMDEDFGKESVFFETDSETDEYYETGPIKVRGCSGDPFYPVEITAEMKNGRSIGLDLTADDVKRILVEANIAGVRWES